jgi:hypothetical protein
VTIRIHHVGYVVAEIQAFAAGFPGLSLQREAYDPLQRATLALYSVGDGTRLEFIAPEGPESFTWAFLQRSGPGMHHVCYEGLSALQVDEAIHQHRMLKLRGPMPAVLFDRDVVFAMTRQKSIVEFLL